MIDTAAFVDLTRGFFGDAGGGRCETSIKEQEEEEDLLAEALTYAYLLRCLARKEWTTARDMLGSMLEEEEDDDDGDDDDGKRDTANNAGERRCLSSHSSAVEFGLCPGSNFVHALCWYDAPVDIARTVLDLCPGMTSEQDSFGRTPLHVAAAGCAAKGSVSLGLVRCLLSQCPSAAEMQDRDGFTPLMRACKKMNNKGSAGAKSMVFKGVAYSDDACNKDHIALVTVLALGAPESVLLEDKHERTALEHAILARAPRVVVETLQAVTIDVRQGKREAFDYEAWS